MMEQSREEKLRRLATIVRDSNDAILLVDFEGDIKAWNRGVERIYGYSEAEMLNKNIQLLCPELGEAPLLGLLKRLQKGEDITSYETKRLIKDGRVRDIRIALTALKDETGKPYTVATTERGITDIKKNAEALKETVERLQFETEQLWATNEELEVANEELL